jgi:UV DNA damage endonuclease
MQNHNLKLGLCCLFHNEPIKFKTYTKTALQKLSMSEQIDKILLICSHNIKTIQEAMDYCSKNNIESYRFSSDLLPHFTYISSVLSEKDMSWIFEKLAGVNTKNIKLSCHPGQFVNLGSPTQKVVHNSVAELEYHSKLCESLNSNECNIHIGSGTYNSKESAKARFIETYNLYKLKHITIENDEISYSVEDCLEVANELKIPVTFDLHHHRCHLLKPEYISELSEHELFLKCKQTWLDAGYNYMRMHLSNPKIQEYTTASKSRGHSDMIYDLDSIPGWLKEESLSFDIHLDIEAKNKETAIFDLLKKL